MLPRIAITPGEPAGIGPDILLDVARHDHDCDLIVFADPDMLRARAAELQLPITITACAVTDKTFASAAGNLRVIPIRMPSVVRAGKPDSKNAHYIMETLRQASAACMNHHCHALVTGPINKGTINDAGIPFSGHTEYLADITQTPKVVMMLASPLMRVALVTTHLPLSKVPAAITYDNVYHTIRITLHDLRTQFSIPQPCIMVAGLNPHAGENGHLGREEIDYITPAIAALRQEGHNVIGPLSADTMFSADNIQRADVFITMYHDQGLPVIKHSGFGDTVNITLGLPFFRMSVDHGTALDVAGTGKASSTSLQAAINMTISVLNTTGYAK